MIAPLRHLALGLLLVFAWSGSALAKTDRVTFEVRDDEDTASLDIRRFDEGGCLLARVPPWSRYGSRGSPASRLTLEIREGSRTRARATGGSTTLVPLWVSYAVDDDDAAAYEEGRWTIRISNPGSSGSAEGDVFIEYPTAREPTLVPCALRAVPSRTRGRVDVSWSYTGATFAGTFLVERSANVRTWTTVASCTQQPGRASRFSCSDTGLARGTYYYRACAVSGRANRCTSQNVTPALSVQVS